MIFGTAPFEWLISDSHFVLFAFNDGKHFINVRDSFISILIEITITQRVYAEKIYINMCWRTSIRLMNTYWIIKCTYIFCLRTNKTTVWKIYYNYVHNTSHCKCLFKNYIFNLCLQVITSHFHCKFYNVLNKQHNGINI